MKGCGEAQLSPSHIRESLVLSQLRNNSPLIWRSLTSLSYRKQEEVAGLTRVREDPFWEEGLNEQAADRY